MAYQRMYGPNGVGRPGVNHRWTPEQWEKAFLAKVVKTDAGCWEWTGTRLAEGGRGHLPYGMVWLDGRMQYAHRAYWEHVNGPIPTGLEIDHLCRNAP